MEEGLEVSLSTWLLILYAVHVLAFPVAPLCTFSSNAVQDKSAVETFSSEQRGYELVSAM